MPGKKNRYRGLPSETSPLSVSTLYLVLSRAILDSGIAEPFQSIRPLLSKLLFCGETLMMLRHSALFRFRRSFHFLKRLSYWDLLHKSERERCNRMSPQRLTWHENCEGVS